MRRCVRPSDAGSFDFAQDDTVLNAGGAAQAAPFQGKGGIERHDWNVVPFPVCFCRILLRSYRSAESAAPTKSRGFSVWRTPPTMHGCLRQGSGQALRWEPPALRAAPLPQDDSALGDLGLMKPKLRPGHLSF